MRRRTPVRIAAWTNALRPWSVVGAVLVAVTVLMGGVSVRGSGDAATPSANPAVARASASTPTARISASSSPTATVSAWPSPGASATSSAARSPAPSPIRDRAPAEDIANALATESSWVAYISTTYRFSIWHPTDWLASEASEPGWATFRGPDDSNVSVTWRTVAAGSTLGGITNEVWQALEANGYAVGASHPSTIAGLPGRVLTANGISPLGHARHGLVGVLVTAGGRYRVELWSNPGTEADDLTLFRDFISTFAPTS
jgi:hypothetical protein